MKGVHRTGQEVSSPSMLSNTQVDFPTPALDVSADLLELTRCPVALVSVRVKSIFGIRRLVFGVHSNVSRSDTERLQVVGISRRSRDLLKSDTELIGQQSEHSACWF